MPTSRCSLSLPLRLTNPYLLAPLFYCSLCSLSDTFLSDMGMRTQLRNQSGGLGRHLRRRMVEESRLRELVTLCHCHYYFQLLVRIRLKHILSVLNILLLLFRISINHLHRLHHCRHRRRRRRRRLHHLHLHCLSHRLRHRRHQPSSPSLATLRRKGRTRRQMMPTVD